MKKILTPAVFFFVCALSFGASVSAPSAENISAARLDFISNEFLSGLREISADSGAMCVVSKGKTLFGKDFILRGDNAAVKKFPLGNTSQTLLSLMLSAMEKDGKIASDWKVARHCSYFRLGAQSAATFDDLISMRAGIDSHSDSLVPSDASAFELFEIAGQIPPVSAPKEYFSRSKLSVSLAGYAIGYVFDKSQKNMKKSFAACAKKYIFEPLKMSDPRFSSFDKPFFPATAFAFSIADCSRWLECETSKNPPVSSSSEISKRRLSRDASDRFGGGWLASNEKGVHFFVSADYWEGCANVVAIIPSENLAAAFFAKSKDSKSASKLCADTLSKFLEMSVNPK